MRKLFRKWLDRRKTTPQSNNYSPPRFVPGEPHQFLAHSIAAGSFRNPRKGLLEHGASVFTMGSCFANEMRAFLEERQIGRTFPKIPPQILPMFHEASHGVSSWGAWDGTANLQYYNTFSIRQEIEKAVGLWKQNEDDYWQVPFGDKLLFQCPYRRKIFASTPHRLHAITAGIDQAIIEGLINSKLIVLTLGLTEVWRKKNNGMVSCCEPGYCHGGGHEETEFVASTYEQNLDNVTTTIDVIQQHFKQKHILISVSPVPLGRTFRPLEAYVANMESKCILRSVAGAVDVAYDNVTYFPSFEMCLSDPKNTFRDDGRHVRQEKVDQIMELFAACHVIPMRARQAA